MVAGGSSRSRPVSFAASRTVIATRAQAGSIGRRWPPHRFPISEAMPLLTFDTLPPSARVWVFGSLRPLDDSEAARLIAETDRFLEKWNAHGHPLYSGREWRDDRFLAIAVDQSTAGASGCSIDGLYRSLRALETALGTELLSGAADGQVDHDTVVFDLSVETLGDWRERFETAARNSWHAPLIGRN